MTSGAPLTVASNRGPVTFVRAPDGSVAERRGVGGLVSVVGDALRGRPATWIAAAMTEEDRTRTSEPFTPAHEPRMRVRLVELEPDLYDRYYNEFSNRILWFLHHYLWDPARTPSFGPHETDCWEAYREVNDTFARLLAEEAAPEGLAFPQDYHLSLVPGALARLRPDLAISLFWHVPFCQPDQYRSLPDPWSVELLEGLLAARVVGFQTQRWAENFLRCAREVLGARVRGRTVEHAGGSTRIAVYPVGVDHRHLRQQAAHPGVAEHVADLERIADGRRLILRVDRTELSKNILTGLVAYERLLERRRDLCERIVHVALLAPSRREVPEYQEYVAMCEAQAARVNDRFGTAGWTPVILEIEDDYPRTLAGYIRYDVLLVNPVYDGMNLVAREGAVLNERDGAVVLSRNAGAASALSNAAIIVNPFDALETAQALERALDMDPAERARRAAELRARAPGTPPSRWLDQQIRDLERARAQRTISS